MPRPAKPARLHRRGDGGYVILDRGKYKRTGTNSLVDAEKALALYISQKERVYSPDPEKITVSACLEIYMRIHAPTVAAPERIAYAADPLIEFWGESPVSHVKAATCRRYTAQRNVSDGTIRRELTTLRAALNFCHREGYLLHAPPVTMPDRPPPRERWLTRREAAQFLNAARQLPQGRHLARFALIALYTGTRKDAILRLQFRPNTLGGWIDVENGLLYRRSANERQTKKRQPPARLPRQLLTHARRWKASGSTFAVEWNGGGVKDVKKAFANVRNQTGLHDVTPHTFRHTAITWALQNGATVWDAAGYFGVSAETIERTYGHHSPDFQSSAVSAMEG